MNIKQFKGVLKKNKHKIIKLKIIPLIYINLKFICNKIRLFINLIEWK